MDQPNVEEVKKDDDDKSGGGSQNGDDNQNKAKLSVGIYPESLISMQAT